MGRGALISGLGAELGAFNSYGDFYVETYQFLQDMCLPVEHPDRPKHDMLSYYHYIAFLDRSHHSY